jgi:hypothetical protein
LFLCCGFLGILPIILPIRQKAKWLPTGILPNIPVWTEACFTGFAQSGDGARNHPGKQEIKTVLRFYAKGVFYFRRYNLREFTDTNIVIYKIIVGGQKAPSDEGAVTAGDWGRE